MLSHTIQWGLFGMCLLVALVILGAAGYLLGKWYTERDARVRKSELHNRAMFERSFLRPKNFFHLSFRDQVMIDRTLGILGWHGKGMTKGDWRRFKNHYTRWDGTAIRFQESISAKKDTATVPPNIKQQMFLMSQINNVEKSFGDSLK